MNIPALTIVPLVPNVVVPRNASARTRSTVPPGYGVQEQCLPFTAASALGFLIPAPIDFGLCNAAEVPAGCHAFRSPVPAGNEDQRVFYVADRLEIQFRGNAYEFAPSIREPGLSFFDRPDQQDLFKLHLPYIWRTQEGVDTLFFPMLNRDAQGISVQSGLVETDWYTSPVNLILRKGSGPVHFRAGDDLAQAILIPRTYRRPTAEVAAEHARITRESRKGLAEWDRQHAADPSAYKTLARSHHGRFEKSEQ